MIECKICGKHLKSLRSLPTHLQMKHNDYDPKIYYDEFIKVDSDGVCKSCGEQTTFRGIIKGYNKYCSKNGCCNYDMECRKRISESNKLSHSRPEYVKRQQEIWRNKPKEEIKEIVDKRKNTCLGTYGVDNPRKSKVIIEKMLETKKKNRPSDPTNREKFKKTLSERYGCEHNWQNGVLRDREIKHWIELWGVDNCMKVPEYCKKQQDSYAKNHNGARSRWQIPELQKIDSEKGNSHEARKKAIQTARQNGKRSSYEELLENFLTLNDIRFEVEYNKDERYPYLCDFYLVDYDIFIEINGYWVHGNHFFDENNQDDIETLNEWKEKALNSSMYQAAMKTWAEKDILKRNTALKNNINYIVLWNIEDINNFCSVFEEIYL